MIEWTHRRDVYQRYACPCLKGFTPTASLRCTGCAQTRQGRSLVLLPYRLASGSGPMSRT